MTYQIDLTERTLNGSAKGDGIRWRQYGLLWSRNRGCWVWARTTTPQRIRQAVYQLERDFPDQCEVTGTADVIDVDMDERDRRLAETHDARAARAQVEADLRFGQVDQTMAMIPMGQPILIGHHSEGRHRRDLARMDTNMRKGVEATKTAEQEAKLAADARWRLENRDVQRVAEPVPPELLVKGMDVEWMGVSGSTRRYTIHRVNRTTITWVWQHCSGKRPLDRIFRAWDADGRQVWPEHIEET